MDEALNPRQEAILRVLVREYIRGGDPVGSKELVRRYRLGVSPATVRNEMARLEELNYLMQPHTSSGRVPTDRAYRFFVDNIEPPFRLPKDDQRAVDEEFDREPDSLDELLNRATDVMSRVTHHAAAVLAPRLGASRLRHLDLVPLGSAAVLVVIVADNGRVEQRIVRPDVELSEEDVERVAQELKRELHGLEIDDARGRVRRRAERAHGTDAALLNGVVAALEQTLAGDMRLYVGGASHLADEETFERETLRHLYEVLESQTLLLQLLSDALARPVTVRIGSEMPGEMHPCSIVLASYMVGDRPAGTLGVLGPTRMDYRRVMAATQTVASRLAGTLGTMAE